MRCVVPEQEQRPYGKIEDGLPRWYAKLRESEHAVRPQHTLGAGHHAGRAADLGPHRHRAGQRRLALAKGGALDPVLALARENAAVRRALYLCVSGEETYRKIVRDALRTDAILPEVNVELVWKRLVFMASAGKTGISDGVLIDDDFLLSERQGRFSHTRSSVTDEGVTFINADIGFRLVSWLYSERSAPGYVDVLAGYQYWREKYVAYGATGILDFFGVFDNVVDSHIKVITQDYNWQSVRLGFRYHIPGPAGIGFKARVFFIPWTHSELKDVHHLRTDLKQNPSFASRAEGGFGTQLEGGLTYTPWPWLTFEAGYQYWGINPGEGVKYTYSIGAGTFRDKLNEQKIERYGPYVGVQGRF